MKPETPEDYFKQTEHAVKHLYEGLRLCWSYYEQALNCWDLSKVAEPLTPELKADLDRYLQLAGKYFDLKFSEATFAGSILQVAAMGIRYFSRNKFIPLCCKDIVPNSADSVIPFCIGRELHGLPIGLIIYSAINQYNHWDENPYKITSKVFAKLAKAYGNNMLYDLAFDIGNPTITVQANEILLGAMGWTTYERYLAEMGELLHAQ